MHWDCFVHMDILVLVDAVQCTDCIKRKEKKIVNVLT